MQPGAVIAIAFVVLLMIVILIFFRFVAGLVKKKEEEMKQGATTRGWKFEIAKEGSYRFYRYSGSTDGIQWIAESARLMAGGQQKRRRRHVGRLHVRYSPGINAPLLAMGVPKGKEKIGDGVMQGDGFLAQMAQKAAGFAMDQSIDIHFGTDIGAEVDARTLKHVAAAPVPGFILMAGNLDEASRVLSEGLERALEDATQDKGSILSDNDRPYVLFRPGGISIARTHEFRDIKEIERFVHAGMALTRAFRFGRRA